MAADRQRLAQALAAEAARRKMFESIPEAAGQGLPQAPERPMGWNDYLENLSIGLGRGAVNQLEGLKGLVTSPVESVKGIVSGVGEAIRNPRMIAEALQRTGERAASGPLGLGEVVGENFNMARVPSAKPVMSEINVYHGSPYVFDKFDASKIGTGEGAQAYGHGIYLAESPDVAKDYANRLWKNKFPAGRSEAWSAESEFYKAQKNYLQSVLDNAPKETKELLKNQVDVALEGIKKAKREVGPQTYTADLPDPMVEQMLDYDKPLKDQPAAYQAIRNMIPADVVKDFDANVEKGITGGNAYSNWVWGGKTPAGRSEKLRQAGIPGIQYLDAGSRGQGGTGTRNFVVFPGEETKVKILKRE
jgi:hypothetical protein